MNNFMGKNVSDWITRFEERTRAEVSKALRPHLVGKTAEEKTALLEEELEVSRVEEIILYLDSDEMKRDLRDAACWSGKRKWEEVKKYLLSTYAAGEPRVSEEDLRKLVNGGLKDGVTIQMYSRSFSNTVKKIPADELPSMKTLVTWYLKGLGTDITKSLLLAAKPEDLTERGLPKTVDSCIAMATKLEKLEKSLEAVESIAGGQLNPVQGPSVEVAELAKRLEAMTLMIESLKKNVGSPRNKPLLCIMRSWKLLGWRKLSFVEARLARPASSFSHISSLGYDSRMYSNNQTRERFISIGLVEGK
jgi:hypothetical protein